MKKILILGLVVIMALFGVGCDEDDNIDGYHDGVITQITYINMTDRILTIDLGNIDEIELEPEESFIYNYAENIFDYDNEYIQTYILNGEYFDKVSKQFTVHKGISVFEEIYAFTKVSFTNSSNHVITLNLGDDIINDLQPYETMDHNYSPDLFDETNIYIQTYSTSGEYIDNQVNTVTIYQHHLVHISIVPSHGYLSFTNILEKPIHALYIKESNTTSFGDNLLNSTLYIGDEARFLKLAGNYDVKLRPEQGSEILINMVCVTADKTISAINYLNVVNDTASYISSALNSENSEIIQSHNNLAFSVNENEYTAVSLHATGYYIFDNDKSFDFSSPHAIDYVILAEGGVINIINSTTANITDIYISPAADEYWGNDYMSDIIAAGESSSWTTEPGLWDVKIVDDEGYESIVINIEVILNQTDNIDYTDDKRVRTNSSDIKNKTHYNYPKIEGRVEAN